MMESDKKEDSFLINILLENTKVSKLSFSKISIVESLSEGERKTGEQLYDDLNMLEIFHEKGITLQFTPISNRVELEDHIEYLARDAQERNEYPVLHIEAHGSDDKQSLMLSSGEFVNWFELEDIFRKLNVATKCNLLVVMATCFGAYTSSVISLLDRAPFWGIVGPEKEILPEVVFSNLKSFYSDFFQNGASANPLKTLSSENSSEMKFITSEWFFVKAYEYYERNLCNEVVLHERAERLVEKLISQGATNLPSIDVIKLNIGPHGEDFFRQAQRNFFMVDLYQENVDKISSNYNHLNL
jgi:hypothetical protein